MKCLIIEDEKAAAERLKNQILQYNETIQILDIIQSVKRAVQWFNKNSEPDLVFPCAALSRCILLGSGCRRTYGNLEGARQRQFL